MARRKRSAMQMVAVYLSLAIVMPVSAAVGYFIGRFLDESFKTHFLTLVFLLLGFASGMIQILRQVMRDSRDDND